MHQIYATLALEIATDRMNEAADWRRARAGERPHDSPGIAARLRGLAGRLVGLVSDRRPTTLSGDPAASC